MFYCASPSQRFSYSFFREAFPESVEVFAQALHQVLADQHRVVIRAEFAQLFEIFTLPRLLIVMGVVVASGLIICVISTWFVVNKLVSLDKDELYY